MTHETFAARVLQFYDRLKPPTGLPRGIEILFPYRKPEVRECMRAFYGKYFHDPRARTFVLGINPGRFGAGVSGVPFTDGTTLRELCDIPSGLPNRRELSARFIQAFIERWGGTGAFYHSFFISAVSPVGFTRDGRNVNYYDYPDLLKATRPFIVRTLQQQLEFGARRDVAIVLGTGRNFQVFAQLNDEHAFFQKLLVVEHPRFIMQYRQKRLNLYLSKYEEVFRSALECAEQAS